MRYQSWEEFDAAVWPKERGDDDTTTARDRVDRADLERLQREAVATARDLAAEKRRRHHDDQ